MFESFSIFSKALNTAQDIPSHYFKVKKEITCVVVKVTDGDTYRLRHVTRWRPSASFDGNLKDNTIVVRIAAVDTPETAKYGKTGQPFGKEAMEFAHEKLLGKTVKVKLLSLDQYGRVIGLVKFKETAFVVFSRKRDISEQLLSEGLAVVYRQGGAQYDGSIERWNRLEAAAIKRKKGMWVSGVENVQLPSEYKKTGKADPKNNAKRDANRV